MKRPNKPNFADYIDETNIALFEKLMNHGAIEALWSGSKEFAFSVDEENDLIFILIPKEDKSKRSFAVILVEILYYFIEEEKQFDLLDDQSVKGIPHPHPEDFGKWAAVFNKKN